MRRACRSTNLLPPDGLRFVAHTVSGPYGDSFGDSREIMVKDLKCP
jgi:hypothetical protein